MQELSNEMKIHYWKLEHLKTTLHTPKLPNGCTFQMVNNTLKTCATLKMVPNTPR